MLERLSGNTLTDFKNSYLSEFKRLIDQIFSEQSEGISIQLKSKILWTFLFQLFGKEQQERI